MVPCYPIYQPKCFPRQYFKQCQYFWRDDIPKKETNCGDYCVITCLIFQIYVQVEQHTMNKTCFEDNCFVLYSYQISGKLNKFLRVSKVLNPFIPKNQKGHCSFGNNQIIMKTYFGNTFKKCLSETNRHLSLNYFVILHFIPWIF